jgi:uncharacterized membrane protein
MTGRPFKIALAASVLLNIFLVAALVGGAASVHRLARPSIGPGSLRIAGAELPRDTRRAFRRHLRAARRAAQSDIAASRAARQQASVLLEQRVLDRAALDTALTKARVADFAVRAQLEAGAVDFIARLAPADRMRLAEAMRQRAKNQR